MGILCARVIWVACYNKRSNMHAHWLRDLAAGSSQLCCNRRSNNCCSCWSNSKLGADARTAVAVSVEVHKCRLLIVHRLVARVSSATPCGAIFDSWQYAWRATDVKAVA